MRKISLLLIMLSTSSWSMSTVNLSNHTYKCSGIPITKLSTVEQLTKNCKNAKLVEREDTISGRNSDDIPGGGADMTEDDSQSNLVMLDKVKFFSDNGSYLICYFKNDVLTKCKANPPQPTPNTTSAIISNQIKPVESK